MFRQAMLGYSGGGTTSNRIKCGRAVRTLRLLLVVVPPLRQLLRRHHPQGRRRLHHHHRGTTALHAGDSLKSGATLVSPGGKGSIQMQGDGNLVIRDSSHNSRWHSDSAGHSGAQLNFHSSDGNLVVKDSHGQSYWSSGAHQGAASACITDDCSLVVKDASGHSLWSSGSTCSSVAVEVI